MKPGSTVMPDYKKNQNSEYRFMGPVPTVAGEKRDKYPSHETYLTLRQGVQFQQRAANTLNNTSGKGYRSGSSVRYTLSTRRDILPG